MPSGASIRSRPSFWDRHLHNRQRTPCPHTADRPGTRVMSEMRRRRLPVLFLRLPLVSLARRRRQQRLPPLCIRRRRMRTESLIRRPSSAVPTSCLLPDIIRPPRHCRHHRRHRPRRTPRRCVSKPPWLSVRARYKESVPPERSPTLDPPAPWMECDRYQRQPQQQ